MDQRVTPTSDQYRNQTRDHLLRFREAMDISGDAIYLVNRATMRYVDVNATACSQMGYSREELLKLGPQNLLDASREQLEQAYDAVIAAGSTGTTNESSARSKDGRKSVSEIHRRALRSGDGWMIVSIARDVTRRKRAERASLKIGRMYSVLSATNEAILHAKLPEELYQKICDAAVQGGQLITAATVYTPDRKSMWMNIPAAAGADQLRRREARVSRDEARVEGRGLVGTAFRTLKSCVSNDLLNDARLLPWRKPALEMRHLAAVAVPVLKGGHAVGVLHFCSDEVDVFDDETIALLERMGENVSFALENFEGMAEHQRAEEALRESERKYRNVFESLQDVYFETTLDGTILEVSPQIEVLTRGQYKTEDLLGKSTVDLYADPQRRNAIVLALKANGRVTDVESTFVNRDGSLVSTSISAKIQLDANGQPRSIVSTTRDITERKRAEEAMRAAEQQFRGLVEQSIAGIYIIQDGRFAYVNGRYAEIFGYATPDELIGRDPHMLVSEKDRPLISETIRQQIESNAQTVSFTFTFTGLCKDGSTIEAGAHGARSSHLGRPAVIGLMQDISEKKRAEDQIKQYVAKLEGAFMRTVEVTMTLSELRDPYTAGHERRVAEIAVAIGAELGFDAHRQEGLRVAGYLHDVGKISIPAEILSKPGKLSAAEFALVRCHAQASYDILKNVEFPWPVAQVALQHHERLDGSGYPQRLKGEAIILEVRIISVADVVEAMSSHRPYRPGLGIENALAEITRGRGTAYDPVVVDACLTLFRQKGYTISA